MEQVPDQITLKGDHLKVVLNDELIQHLNLSEQNQEVKRHDGNPAPPAISMCKSAMPG